ncbi:unnamed protein product [Phytophthora lilii]|uniref:Unnamed protein product n=1 Tax=Phytophthora lilii TaxID=2077276 RepID=A0A9W6WRJ8_9STRA|nr:unnamed protein product [Phytophthora lilii]
MIEFPIDLDHPRETVTLLHSTRDWAIQTVLNIRTAQSSAKEAAEDAMQPATMSASLQQLQAKLFVSAPCRQADVQMELNQSLLAAVGDEEQLSDAMEICATGLYDDAEFLQFAEAALSGKMESVAFGSAFLQRLFDRRAVQLQSDEQVPTASLRRGQRLFDALSLDSQIRVWANHLPSWRSQLQKWMLEAHRSPFQTLSAVLPDGWWAEDDANYAYSGTIAVAAVCRRHSHLYVTFVEWCRTHVNLLASCRSVELVCLLSQSLRQENTAHLFKRQLLSQVLSINHLSVRWSPEQRQRVFITLGRNLKRLQTTRSISDDSRRYEWIGILEQPHLLHEALESTFTGSDESEKAEKNQIGARAAAEFFGWFYSFSNVESAGEIAAIVTQMSAELKVSDVRDGAQWLRRSRADFDVLPILRLRIVWFWLLKSIDTELQTPASASNNTAAAVVTDVLESVEYIFRRFTPSWSRR